MEHHDEPRPHEQRTHGGGRHRRGGSPRRRAGRAPSFRTAVTLAGAATAALTVAAGAYVASLGSPSGTDTRSEGVALTNVAPLIGRSAPPPTGPSSPAPAPADPAGAAATGVTPAGTPSPPRSAPAAPGPAPKESASAPAPVMETPSRAPGPEKAVVAAPEPGGGGKAAQFVEQIVALTNTEREKAGCSPLRADGRLHDSAQAHADDMADRDYYAHATPEGRDAGERITAAGYTWSSWAENIHRGPKTPVRAMEDWMNSDGHRRNILNCSFKDLGVGVALTSNGPWWVQNFGIRR
ncbi:MULTISPECIES: CAP domain-containing protein [unclassified Streptomyces]|uniref:CAP domain-containing protein n=1 Tax=Streptomyces sp. NPDC127129 TaxID=3345373 RepID=UPI0036411D52